MNNNWSIEAIQETAANNWSLEGDNQLLNLMKSISKNLEQRCMTSNNNLNRLVLDVDKTKIKLRNATTKLLDLNNSKFVEHTVMDMVDSSLSNTEKCSTTENDKKFVALPKAVEEAVTNGLNMMDRCYEKVLLNLEDSDDENENDNGQKHVVCRPKDPYLNRPLPYLIGSKQWNDKWHIGLIESDEEVLSDDEPEEQFSQSSSDGEDSLSNSPKTSNPPTSSESEFAAASAPPFIPREDLFHRLADDDETKSSLFAPENNNHREKIKVLPTSVPSIQNDVKTESTNKTKQLTQPPVPAPEPPKQSIFVQQKTEPNFHNLFDDEPPSLDEPIRHERKPVNLFLDSDDDDDSPITGARKPSSIFNNNVASRPSPPFSIPQTDNVPKVDRTENAFPGAVDNNNVPPVAKSESKSTSKSNDFGGLFDDEPPDDFFDIIVRERGVRNGGNRAPDKPKLQSKTVNLFESDDDEDDDDDFSKIIGTTKKKDSSFAAAGSKERVPVVKTGQASYSPYSSPYKSYASTAPPKSYVSFLDDESPIVDDDKTETSAAAPLSRTSLFDDTPPEDLVVPVALPKREVSTKIIYDDIAATLQEKSAIMGNVSSEKLNNETSRPDDVSVEAPPVAMPRKSSSNVNVVDKPKAIASDEIPVPNTETRTPKSDEGSRDETDQSLSFKKNLRIFSNPATTLPTVDKESKPKPNKLKTNFNINVAALLPGAKLPSQKQSATEKADLTVEPDPEPESIENVSKESSNSANGVKQISSSEDTSGRLTSLSKNRARIKVQRKPSTRTGRQNLYNKTLRAEHENVDSSVETTDSVRSEIDAQQHVIDVAPSENVSKSDVEESDWLSEKTVYDQPPPLESDNSSANVVAASDQNVVADTDPNVDAEEDWLQNIDEKPSSPSETNLYEDEWLSTKEVNVEQKQSTQKMSHVMNYDWLTASSLPPEDINPPSSYSIDDDHEQDDWLTSYVSKEKSSAAADLPNEDDDWLITSVTQEKPREAVSIVAVAKGTVEEVEQDWLLNATLESENTGNQKADDHDDDDWFTRSLGPPKPSTSEPDKEPTSVRKSLIESQAEPSSTIDANAGTKKSKLFDSDEVTRSELDFDRKSSNIFESKQKPKSFLSSTIFDDDDDDAFTAVPSVDSGRKSEPDVLKRSSPPTIDFSGESFKTKTETKKSLNSKLFDDDDDDDDDLFTSVSQKKSSATPAVVEAAKTTKNVSIKANAKSLFSDDDNSDPDDLFGTTTKNQKEKRGAAPKKQTTEKSVNASLFDDEDDDDDIFAPKTQKHRPAQADTKKKPSNTKSVTTIPASNDPLADLLK